MVNVSKERVEELWSQFKTGFWLLFFLHIVIKGFISMVNNSPSPTATLDSISTANLWLLIAGLCVAVSMMCLVGWTSYKISGKKSHLLNGLLGAVWFAIVFIFFSYWAVRNDYYRATGKQSAKGFKLI